MTSTAADNASATESLASTSIDLTRRSLLRGAAAGAALACAGDRALRAVQAPAVAAVSGSVAPVVSGSGAHTYELVRGWWKPPASLRIGFTHGIVEDAQGRIIVHHQGSDAVAFFDPDGRFVQSWGESLALGAHGIAIASEGNQEFLYFAPSVLHKIVKTTLDGEVVWERGVPPLPGGVYDDPALYNPTAITVAPNGDVYVADGYGQSWIHRYDKNALYLQSWGGKGKELGRLDTPHGLAIDLRGDQARLLVADRANIRLQYFSLDGKPLGEVSGDFRYPAGVRVRGSDVLVPDLLGRVTILGGDDRLVTHVGLDSNGKWVKPENFPDVPKDKRVEGAFIAPHDAIWDRDGNLYVVEWVPDGRVSKWRPLAA
jgi:hypothetical protein